MVFGIIMYFIKKKNPQNTTHETLCGKCCLLRKDYITKTEPFFIE